MHASGLAEAIIHRIPDAVTDRLPGAVIDQLPHAASPRRHRLLWLGGLGAAAYGLIRFGRPALSWIRSKAGHRPDLPDSVANPISPEAKFIGATKTAG